MVSFAIILFLFHNSSMYVSTHFFCSSFAVHGCFLLFSLSVILFLSFFYLLFTNLLIADIYSYAPVLHSYCTYTSIHFQELHLLFAQNKHRKDFCLCGVVINLLNCPLSRSQSAIKFLF